MQEFVYFDLCSKGRVFPESERVFEAHRSLGNATEKEWRIRRAEDVESRLRVRGRSLVTVKLESKA